jgi:hypothetical protein
VRGSEKNGVTNFHGCVGCGGSNQETKSVRAVQVASLKLASVIENTDRLPTKPPVLGEFADRFLDWVNNSRREEKTKKFYFNGWRLLKPTSVAVLRIDQITGDCAGQLKFPGSAGVVTASPPAAENSSRALARSAPGSRNLRPSSKSIPRVPSPVETSGGRISIG